MLIKGLNWEMFSKHRNVLMGLSIIVIMVFHWCEDYKIYHIVPQNFSRYFISNMAAIGMCGVEIFLFLSGIGLYFSFKKNEAIKDFIIKHCLKVFIPYALTAIPYLIWQDFFYTNRGVKLFFADLSLFTTFLPINRQSWYVGLILILYVLFPFFYFVLTKFGKKSYFFMIIFFSLLPWLVMFVNKGFFNLSQVALTRVPVFLLGIYCGEKVYEKKDMIYYPWMLLIVNVFIHMIYLWQESHGVRTTIILRYDKCAFTLLLLLLITIALEKFELSLFKRMCVFFAPLTLELYMLHVELRRFVHRVFLRRPSFLEETLAFIIIIVLSIILSLIIHKYGQKLYSRVVNCLKDYCVLDS